MSRLETEEDEKTKWRLNREQKPGASILCPFVIHRVTSSPWGEVSNPQALDQSCRLHSHLSFPMTEKYMAGMK